MPIFPIPPEFSQFEPTAKGTSVKGVFVGGCVNRGDGSSFRAKAHAHARAGIKNCGWIGVSHHRRVRNKVTGQLTRTMWHEYAHIMAVEGHTDAWRKYMHDVLHQPVPARYKKRRRLVIPRNCTRTTSYGYQCREWAGGVKHFCPRYLSI